MSDIVGHRQPRLVAPNLKAVEVLARYGRAIAKTHVLGPSGAPFVEFRPVAAPSFYCRVRLVPFDQTSESLEFEGIDVEGRSVKGRVGAALLRLEFWPVRVLLLDLPVGGGTAQWHEQSGGSGSLNSREAVAAAGASISRQRAEPHLTIHLRNRGAADPVSTERQKMQRKLLNLHKLKADPHMRFLCVRSIYVGVLSSHEDLKSQIALVLLQAGILERDSAAGDWFCNEYLYGFLPKRVKVRGRKVAGQLCATAFTGLWKNAGNAEFAPAWRDYVKTWIDKTSSNYLRLLARGKEVDAPDDESDGNEDHDALARRGEEVRGALPSNRKRQRDVPYMIPREDTGTQGYSVTHAAKVLSLSVRQVYRLIKSGRLQITSVHQHSAMLDPVEVETLAGEFDGKRALQLNRLKTIRRLTLDSGGKLKPSGARKAEYRARTRSVRRPPT